MAMSRMPSLAPLLLALASCSVGATAHAVGDGAASKDIGSGLAAKNDEVPIQDFSHPTFDWEAVTDQVMGGTSTSELNIENGVAHLTGTCEMVPFRNSPGFVSLHGGQHWSWDDEDAQNATRNAFPDLSRCEGLTLVLKSNIEYAGYHVDIGMRSSHTHGWGYKSPPLSPPTADFGEVSLPFSSFSINKGHRHQSTQQGNSAKEDDVCSSTNQKACPDTETLCNMKSISILGDDIGDIDLEIKSIRAFGCNGNREAAGTCLEQEGGHSGNERSAEHLEGHWKEDVLWFAMGSVVTLAAGAYVLLRRGPTNPGGPCPWSWAVPAPAREEVPVVPSIPVSELV